MQLRSFSVQGFKNFKQKITLDDLGPVNVIHGPNNVGKSNLLQAISLFFFLIAQQQDQGLPIHGFMVVLTPDTLTKAGFPRSEIFSLDMPAPIQIEAEFAIKEDDFLRSGLPLISLPVERVRLALSLNWSGREAQYWVSRLEIADGRDYGVIDRSIDETRELSTLGALISYRLRKQTNELQRRFSLVEVLRSYDPVIALALYDAKESDALDIASQWDRFVAGMDEFEDILGKGKFVAIYNRQKNEATLVRQTQHARIPITLLGSGVQQLVALLALLAVDHATIIGIEEPELNLRYSLQLRLRDMLAKLIGGPGGLDQIFITSHSDAFETGPHFYYMAPSPDGPRVEKRDVKMARESLGITQSTELPHRNAPLCYVSTEGVVRLPPRICKVIGVPNGGGVVFYQPERDDKVVEMMSDDTFTARFESKRDEEADEPA